MSDTCYLVQEIDGVSRFTLEDGSGFLILEDCVPVTTGLPPRGGDRRVRHEIIRRNPPSDDIEELLSVLLSEV